MPTEEKEKKEEKAVTRERVLATLEKALPQIDFTSSDSLVDDGILDSLSIVMVISELSMEFGVKFDIEELMPENLNSVDAMVKTIQHIKEK